MPEPTPPLDLAAIEKRAREAARDCTKPGGWKNAAVYVAERDVPALVAHVRALEAENDRLRSILNLVAQFPVDLPISSRDDLAAPPLTLQDVARANLNA